MCLVRRKTFFGKSFFISHVGLDKILAKVFSRKTNSIKKRKMTSLLEVEKTSSISDILCLFYPPTHRKPPNPTHWSSHPTTPEAQRQIYIQKWGHVNSWSLHKTRYFMYIFSNIYIILSFGNQAIIKLDDTLGWRLSYLPRELAIYSHKITFFLILFQWCAYKS